MAWSQQGAILTAVRDACSPEAVYIYREMHLTGFTGSRATARNILERELVAGNVSRSECPHGNLGYAWKLTDAGHAFLAGAETVGSLRADQILKETGGKLLDAAEKCHALTTRIAELEAQNESLRGLLWYAHHEFNAIRARSGAPLDLHGITIVDEQWWNQMTEAFRSALGEDGRKPWPSDAAIAALAKHTGG